MRSATLARPPRALLPVVHPVAPAAPPRWRTRPTGHRPATINPGAPPRRHCRRCGRVARIHGVPHGATCHLCGWEHRRGCTHMWALVQSRGRPDRYRCDGCSPP